MAITLVAILVALATYVTVRLVAPPPHPVASITVSAPWVPASGVAPALPTPAQGSFAVDVLDHAGSRHAASIDAGLVRPIASVAKTMTALVVLEQHPLGHGQSGPLLTMTALDQADYLNIGASGGSVAPVHTGEQLTERDLLLGLMLPSANNMALTLARWIDGSAAQFVVRLNARAAALGMASTHFADPGGLDAATTSTAADLVVLGTHAVAAPGFVEIVSTQTATLPDGTVIDNLDILLASKPDWIGVKTGWTPRAGGCLLFAARRTLAPGTEPITVIGAVLDQAPDPAGDAAHPELGAAMLTASAAGDAAFAGYAAVQLTSTSLPVSGTARAADGSSPTSLHAAGPDRWVVVRLGDLLSAQVHSSPLSSPLAASSRVGSVTVSYRGRALGSWEVVTDSAVADPSVLYRLLHW